MGEKQSSPVWGPMPYGPVGVPLDFTNPSGHHAQLTGNPFCGILYLFIHSRIQIIYLWRRKSRLCTSTFKLVVIFFFYFFPKIGLI